MVIAVASEAGFFMATVMAPKTDTRTIIDLISMFSKKECRIVLDGVYYF